MGAGVGEPGAAGRHDRFVRDVQANRNNRVIFERWADLGLADAWLVAGCLFQTVWNRRDGVAPESRIKDYDLFYFDAGDLSQEAERAVQARVDAVLRDLGIVVEVANQARVHLWYPAFFGLAYPQLVHSREGIARFLIRGTCVGMRPLAGGGFDVYAPYGLADLYRGLLAPNPLRDAADLFRAKCASYRERWPWLTVDESAAPARC